MAKREVKNDQVMEENQVMEEQKTEMVTVELPLDDNRYRDDVHVIVNGIETVVHRGEPVKVPKYVADVLRDSQRQDAMFTRYSRALQEDFQKGLEQL